MGLNKPFWLACHEVFFHAPGAAVADSGRPGGWSERSHAKPALEAEGLESISGEPSYPPGTLAVERSLIKCTLPYVLCILFVF